MPPRTECTGLNAQMPSSDWLHHTLMEKTHQEYTSKSQDTVAAPAPEMVSCTGCH